MSPTLAFLIGLFVGVLGGIFIIGVLQMAREERRIAAIKEEAYYAKTQVWQAGQAKRAE